MGISTLSFVSGQLSVVSLSVVSRVLTTDNGLLTTDEGAKK